MNPLRTSVRSVVRARPRVPISAPVASRSSRQIDVSWQQTRLVSSRASLCRSVRIEASRPAVKALPQVQFSKIARPSATKQLSLASALQTSKKVRSLSSSANEQKKKRPISPHITIYKFPISAMSSGANRVTGVMLVVGATAASATALLGDCNIPAYVHAFQDAAPILVPIVKFGVAFPIVYHYAAGLRHMYWDRTANMLTLPEVENSSIALFVLAAVLSVGFAFYWC